MTEIPPKAAPRFAPATLVLIAAAILAVAAVAIALTRSSGESAGAPVANAAGAAPDGTNPGDELHNYFAELQEKVRRNPDDDASWYQLGGAYRQIGQYGDAERAFRRAVQLKPRNAEYAAYLAETLLLQGGDTPPPEAEQLFQRAHELDPDNAQARYYLATLKDFHGDHRGALDDLIALLRGAPDDAPWYPQVRDAASAIAQRNHIDIADRLPPARVVPQPQQSAATAAIPGPSQQQMQAATAIPPSQQDEMVQGMVGRLEARLRANPRDADRWMMLMRSRMVLNDPAAARQALNSGLAAFNGDAATQQRLRDAAAELNIPTG
jgi:cytochrome c-type biogenesis protein CcmH